MILKDRKGNSPHPSQSFPYGHGGGGPIVHPVPIKKIPHANDATRGVTWAYALALGIQAFSPRRRSMLSTA